MLPNVESDETPSSLLQSDDSATGGCHFVYRVHIRLVVDIAFAGWVW